MLVNSQNHWFTEREQAKTLEMARGIPQGYWIFPICLGRDPLRCVFFDTKINKTSVFQKLLVQTADFFFFNKETNSEVIP